MNPYFYLLPTEDFHGRIRPALAASWRRHSFVPCRELCAELLPRAWALRERCTPADDEPLLEAVAAGAAFDRTLWKLLAGELLLYGAAELPLVESSYPALNRLLGTGGEDDRQRRDCAPIRQVHFGARDLRFGGGFYRPEHAGYNDIDDVARLADYLEGIDPEVWRADALDGLPGCAGADECAEELELVRDWFPALRALYRGAAERGQIIVCEFL